MGYARALDRARAYADAGADAVLTSIINLRRTQGIHNAWDGRPLVAVPTTYASITANDPLPQDSSLSFSQIKFFEQQ
jgi:2-methylisocitrate lyase-like PEP mutase family enzyme